MKGKEKQDQKALSAAELATKLREAQEKRFRLGFKHKVTPLANPVELRNLRKDIARLKTLIAQRKES